MMRLMRRTVDERQAGTSEMECAQHGNGRVGLEDRRLADRCPTFADIRYTERIGVGFENK
jgi:hypothetical protein